MQGNRHAQVALRPMEEPSVAAGRVVNIKAGSLKRVEACSCLDDGESRAQVGGLDAYRDQLFRRVSVPRNRLAFLERAFNDAADGIFRHLPGFFEGVAERADFRNRGHDHLVAAFFERLEIHRVVVIGHRVTSLRKSRFAHILR